ncbi:hypothetical protein TNCT_203361 [Trichonephila clavata]|uniref:C2H2-type domain-containing protein n=1 Tax=Trichonephila clavata TaxID=2740835 RepID=A0A8X6HLI0_TRICU|nr:hypothetical protein TNCT_203361 [Trichonephila clavata]
MKLDNSIILYRGHEDQDKFSCYNESMSRNSSKQISEVIKRHKCTQCSYSTNNAGHLHMHLLTHSGVRPFLIVKDFMGINIVQQSHIHFHFLLGGVQLYQYQNLFSPFDVKSRNRNNILRWGSSPAKRHRCSLCPYSTNNSSHLQIHLVTHTGERPHKCTKCGKTFSQRSSLRRHIMCHIDLSIQL